MSSSAFVYRPQVQHATKTEAQAHQTQQVQAPAEDLLATEDVTLVQEFISHALTEDGYNPPDPPPLVKARTHCRVREAIAAEAIGSTRHQELLAAFDAMPVEQAYSEAFEFFGDVKNEIGSAGLIDRVQMFVGRIHRAVAKATVSIELPAVEVTLEQRMREFEAFCATSWTESENRSALSVHIDAAANRTIIQICIAKHGPIYITLPGILNPEQVAHNTVRALIDRVDTFTNVCDPLAVLNGAYSTLNFNEMFPNCRVIRAPSGNTERLRMNFAEAHARERLSASNTTIINSAPGSVEAYRRVFQRDQEAISWPTWSGEAELWEAGVRSHGFALSADASRESFIWALAKSENVIVMIAHCDGNEIFMPDPPPDGTSISVEEIGEHREAISANKPFVYLFACEGARLDGLRNFASGLLDAGASGVVASQTQLGGAEGREFLERLLSDKRSDPPIEDVWQAMQETGFREMEVFLA